MRLSIFRLDGKVALVTGEGSGIRRTAICPGAVHTPFVEGYLAGSFAGSEDEERQKPHTRQPIGRMGRPDEISKAALYLASDDAAFVTGSSLVIDGGWTAKEPFSFSSIAWSRLCSHGITAAWMNEIVTKVSASRLKFGQTYANELRHRRPRCGDKWHMDEVVLAIRGKKHSLWRAVDQDGNILDILVQIRRNKKGGQTIFPEVSERAAIRAA